MKLSSIFMICGGLVNIGLAGIFYYYAFISYISELNAGGLVVIGVMLTAVGLSCFQAFKRSGEKTSTVVATAHIMIAFIEFAFSFMFLFFAYGSRDMFLLGVGIPLLLASILLFASYIQRYRETKRKTASHIKGTKAKIQLT